MTSPFCKRCWQLFPGIAASCVTIALHQFGAIAPLENAVYRGFFQIRGTQTWDERVVLITIDDDTLAQLGQFPIARDHYTRLLKRLSQAPPAVIGFNILFVEPGPTDTAFATAIAQAGNVVLASAADDRGHPLMPHPELSQTAIAVGHILKEPEEDGTVHQVIPYQAQKTAFSIAVANTYGLQQGALELSSLEQPLGINWPGRQADLTQYSFADVVSGRVAAAAFEDKIVLVGMTATGIDSLSTPFDYDPPGSSLLVHAAVVDNLLQQRSLHLIDWNARWILLLLATPGLSYWLFGQPFRRQVIIVASGLMGGLAFSLLSFHSLVLWPTMTPLLLWGLTGMGTILGQQLLANLTLQQLLEDLWQQYRHNSVLTLRPETPISTIAEELGPEVNKLAILANSWGWAQTTQIAIAQTVPMGLLAADDHARVWFCNSLAKQWLSVQLKQSLAAVLVPKWLKPEVWQQVRRQLSQRKPLSPIESQQGALWFELRFESLEILAQQHPLLSDGRQGLLLVIENITHRKAIEIQLRSLNQGLEDEVRQRAIELETTNLNLLQEVIERQQAQTKLAYQALHDDLTGLPNRTQLKTRLTELIEQGEEAPQTQFAVLFIDCDRFKLVNDSFGHLVGDKLLQAIAHRLTQCVSQHDLVARFGGDEFTILLTDIKTSQTAVKVAQRIRRQLRKPFMIEAQILYTGCSIGIVLSHSSYQHANEMLRDADTAMYRAKHTNAGNVLFHPEMHIAVRSSLQLETDLRLALQQQELIVHYQPIFRIETQTIAGFEALLRWRHPQQGLVSPERFIPIAEETGMIVAIGQWVLRQACHQLRDWQKRHLVAPEVFMSVNLSAAQFNEHRLLSRIDRILQETQVNSQHLKLEITESVIMANSESAINTFNALKERGIRLGIDDFGTGYSSLSYLHCFPIDVLKVDRSFIQRMTDGQKHHSLVQAIKTLADHFDMKMIAEGIETKAQLEHLKAMNCSLGQGYLLCPPMDCQALERQYLRSVS